MTTKQSTRIEKCAKGIIVPRVMKWATRICWSPASTKSKILSGFVRLTTTSIYLQQACLPIYPYLIENRNLASTLLSTVLSSKRVLNLGASYLEQQSWVPLPG